MARSASSSLVASLALTLGLFASATASAAAPEPAAVSAQKAACSAAYEQGQILQRKGELLAAREKLIVCASDTCPAVLRGDCARWLSDVDAATPSIVIAAHGASGEDVLDVRVLVDGRVVATHLGARGVPLDPGEHTLRFERAGSRAIERRILLREGEKERAIDVSFERDERAAPPPPPPPAPASSPSPGPPWYAYGLTGLGVVAGATFAGFAVAGRTEQTNHLDPCKPSCASSEIDSVHRKYVVADVALGVAVVSLVAAAVVFLLPRRAHAGRAEPTARF